MTKRGVRRVAKQHRWSVRSEAALAGLDPRLRRVADRALEISEVDLVALEGVRTKARQHYLYAGGRTTAELRAKGIVGVVGRPKDRKVTWTLTSNHFADPRTGKGRALDVVPYPIDWDDTHRFDLMAKAFFTASAELQIPIRWGADWDRDGKPRERGESDSPHFELA